MAFLFGSYFGLFFCLKRIIWAEPLEWGEFFKTSSFAILAFWIWFNLVTAPLWNRRSRRLLKERIK